MPAIDTIPEIIERLYQLVNELEAAFPGRPYTPDGHLVGSLGEVLASHYYDLELLPCSTICHDAKSADGRLVQVKATHGRGVALRAAPDHLLVILLKKDGTIEEVYNAPRTTRVAALWQAAEERAHSISVSALRRLMTRVPPHERLPRTA